MLKFKDEISHCLDYGQNAKDKMANKGIRLMEAYNTEMDKSYGKKVIDPHQKRKLAIQDKYSELDSVKNVYIFGEPGSGKSYMCELFYETLDVGHRKKKLHYNEFMLMMHEMEHSVNKKLKGKTGETIAIVGNQFAEDLTFFFVDEF
jgi:predicted ATPase